MLGIYTGTFTYLQMGNSLVRILTGPLSGQGKGGVAAKSVGDFSGPVGGTCSLKEIAVLRKHQHRNGELTREIYSRDFL